MANHIAEAVDRILEGANLDEVLADLLEKEWMKVTKHSVPGVSLLHPMRVKKTKLLTRVKSFEQGGGGAAVKASKGLLKGKSRFY